MIRAHPARVNVILVFGKCTSSPAFDLKLDRDEALGCAFVENGCSNYQNRVWRVFVYLEVYASNTHLR